MKEEWVHGVWHILPEDRKPNSVLWTLFPVADEFDTGQCITVGPFGRKSKGPDSLIDSEGIESEGLSISKETAELVVTAVNEYNKRAQ